MDPSRTKPQDEDTISCCGSIIGESFETRRTRSSCHAVSYQARIKSASLQSVKLQPQQMNELERQLRNDLGGKYPMGCMKERYNNSFHHFRFIVVMLGGLAYGLMLLLRFSISVAILNMVNQTDLYLHEHPNKTVEDFLADGYTLGGEFTWDNEIQMSIMSSYMITYTLPQIMATKVAIRLGNRLAMPISLIMCGVSSLLTPMAAYQSWHWVVALRLLNGLGASAILPLMLNLIEKWMPYEEFSLGLTLAQMLQASITATYPIVAGSLSNIHWSYAFYVPGIVTLIFCVIWCIVITDRPSENPFISQRELNLICGCGKESLERVNSFSSNKSKLSTVETTTTKAQPEQARWTEVFYHLNIYAYIIMWFMNGGASVGFYFILPAYMRQFLKLNMVENGIFCTMICSGGIIAVLWPHPVVRFLQSKFNLSTTSARRISQLLLSFTTAATWVYVGLFHESQLIMFFLNRCFNGGNDILIPGTIMSNYAKAGLSGIVFSMVNTAGCMSIVITSPLIGWLLDYTGQSREGWTLILVAFAATQVLISIIFCTKITADPIEFKKCSKDTEKALPHKNASGLNGAEVVGIKANEIKQELKRAE